MEQKIMKYIRFKIYHEEIIAVYNFQIPEGKSSKKLVTVYLYIGSFNNECLIRIGFLYYFHYSQDNLESVFIL